MMKIYKELKRWGHADFSAIIMCEHCGFRHVLKNGYHDANYHDNIIPEKICPSCRKDRGGIEHEKHEIIKENKYFIDFKLVDYYELLQCWRDMAADEYEKECYDFKIRAVKRLCGKYIPFEQSKAIIEAIKAEVLTRINDKINNLEAAIGGDDENND